MRPVLMCAIAAALPVTAAARHAQTDMSRIPWYPWCAISYGANTEHRSCGFVSYEQCMNAVRPKNRDDRVNRRAAWLATSKFAHKNNNFLWQNECFSNPLTQACALL